MTPAGSYTKAGKGIFQPAACTCVRTDVAKEEMATCMDCMEGSGGQVRSRETSTSDCACGIEMGHGVVEVGVQA